MTTCAPIGTLERDARSAGYSWVLGVDEVGRGPLAGPVTAGGVLLALDDLRWCADVRDSKRLSERRREGLNSMIRQRAAAARVHHVPSWEVDARNVLQASLWAMRCCVQAILADLVLAHSDVLVIVDGKQALLDFSGAQRAVIKADARSFAVASASIIAKVARDHHMQEMHEEFGQYGFDRHKGYPTKAHLAALSAHGPCPYHRRTFRPVAATFSKNVRS